MAIYCSRCSCQCKGNLIIEARKGTYYPFYAFCFDVVQFMETKDLRKVINKNRKPIHLNTN